MVSSNILYSCYVTRSLSSEQFIPEHIFLYQLAGSLTINDGTRQYTMQPGDFCLAKRNRLAKYVKQPPENGEYKTILVRLDQPFLRNFSREYGYTAEAVSNEVAVVKLTATPLLETYVQSLPAYLHLDGPEKEELPALKTKEAVLLLLRSEPGLKNVLFDFSEPGKIDLEAFMNRNFQFNVSLQRFGYLTGRSLTTFKRDFEKIFNNSPGRWLLQKRLREAYYLIGQKRQKPSDVYLEVGFEDLSHFSYAFKKAYGIAPSQLTENQQPMP